jgi:signal transduction histidine kinase
MTDVSSTITLVPELEQLRRLTEIGRAFTYTTSLEQVEQLTVERGAALLAASATVLMVADSDGLLRLRAAHRVAEERLAEARAAGGDVVGVLAELLEVSEDRVLAVPLVVAGSVTGLLAVALPAPGTAADEWLLSALADQAAVALEQARLGGDGRTELEERLRASEGATSAKDRALATLAHDIRSPLGAIDGYCWNMEDGLYGPITDEQRRALARVRMSGRHLLSLLDNVMDMARLDAGSVPLSVEPLRLADVSREAVDIVMPAAIAKLQRLEQSGAPDVVVLGDRARIRQVLVNLLGNAVKFTPQGGGISVVTAERPADGASWGEVRVTDTGPGIPVAERSSVFEPYYRGEGAAKAPGIGLGLAISRALVAHMGGELTLESEVGVGSSFAIRLPRGK